MPRKKHGRFYEKSGIAFSGFFFFSFRNVSFFFLEQTHDFFGGPKKVGKETGFETEVLLFLVFCGMEKISLYRGFEKKDSSDKISLRIIEIEYTR